VRAHGMGVTSAGYLFGGAALVGGMAGSVFGGVWADRRRRARTAGELDVSAVAALLCAPLVALTLISTNPPLFMTAGLLAPLAIFAYFPSLQTVMVDLVPARQLGLAYAINILFLGGIGSALGPFVVGYVSDASGSLGAGLAVTVAGMVLASLLAIVAGRTIRRAASDGHAGS
jgi:predicted MFS family arabinose efflux permease